MMRVFDLFWSTVGLALLSPLFLLVAAAIKMGDGGPVFFRQERIGQDGQAFHILKFRTMSMGSDRAGLPITVGQDARITRVGQRLRSWKIDELPQLVNVFRGEMSLVGPRPEVPRYVALYNQDQAKVLLLRPGITDAASIAYRNENEVLRRTEDPEAFYIQNIMPNKIRINLQYAAHATVWTNFKVILATLGLLPPPVRVRQAGDLRAFDRMLLEAPVYLAIGDQPPIEVEAVNISIGGILLKPRPEIALSSTCNLTISHDDLDLVKVIIAGEVIRTDDQGLAIRFSQPMEAEAYKKIEISTRSIGPT
jgi:lipopolysaccharide/colanic/teichoic acid biosynthesis glycosyltransferase